MRMGNSRGNLFPVRASGILFLTVPLGIAGTLLLQILGDVRFYIMKSPMLDRGFVNLRNNTYGNRSIGRAASGRFCAAIHPSRPPSAWDWCSTLRQYCGGCVVARGELN